MTPAAALAVLHAAGVHVRLDGAGGLRLNALACPAAEVLALARAHRDGIAALLREGGGKPGPDLATPGVPRAWCAGVALLAGLSAPDGITPARWAILAATSQRLLHDHGAALHGAGWDTLDVWGLHATAPTANPSGWGLAWLLGEHGDVLDIGPDMVGMKRGPDGARLAFRRRTGQGGVVAAWELRVAVENRGPEWP